MNRFATLPRLAHTLPGSSEPWRRKLWTHAPEYGAEFVGTAFLMVCVVGAVGLMFAPHSPVPSYISSFGLRLFITGLALGAAGGLVAITPLGRLSGAHLNPAMSLGFFVERRMHLHDLLAYVAAQMAGAALGAWLGSSLFGYLAAGVRDAVNEPGKNVTVALALGGETLATFALAAVVFEMLSRRSLMRWTPLAVVGVLGIVVWLDGTVSGASLNPARSFGPVVVTGVWRLYWVYVLGPCAGSSLAAFFHRYGARRHAHTGKLFHDHNYRSIFTGVSDHVANAQVRRHLAAPLQERPRLRSK
jgi:aquaporin Z